MRPFLSTLDTLRAGRRRPRHPEGGTRSGERGETLIELLVTVLILGTAVVALVGGLGLAVRVSDMHRKQATAGAAVRAFAEALQTKVAANPTGYEECALNTSASYTSAYAGPPTGYTASIDVVMYWNGSAFVATCSPDLGVQRISITVASNDGRASESLDVVLRKPCRLGETCA